MRDLQDRYPQAESIGGDSEFEQLAAKAVGFIEAPALGLDLPRHARYGLSAAGVAGTAESSGRLYASYTEIARRIGAPKSVRAVAGTCAANTVAAAIPCHRVVKNDGMLSGYRWGVERKRTLLERETST